MSVPAIVFCDMDGTLLTSDKEVSARSLELLDWLFERRIPFVPCTGRPASAVPAVVREHPSVTFVVASNGAVVENVRSGERIFCKRIEKDVVLDLYRQVGGLDVTFDVFCDGSVYSERARYEAMGSYNLAPAMLKMLRQVRQPMDMLVPELLATSSAPDKITCFWKEEADRDALEAIIKSCEGVCYAMGDPKDFEMQASGVSKGAALRWLCDYLGIDWHESCAFGDQGNDLTLVEAAGDGVAMANATDPVKAAADHLTLSNDEDGVAVYLMGERA